MGKPVSVDEVRIGENGEIQMVSAGEILTPSSSWVGGQRSREKGGEKSLFRIPGPANFKRLDELEALSEYDQIFVVDTNTVEMAGEPLSVASVAICSVVHDVGGPGTTLTRKIHMGAYEFRGLTKDQERFGWFLVQHAVLKSPTYRATHRYLLVTDHAVTEHAAINDRSSPLFQDTFLAPEFTMGFASSDSGSSYLQKVIRECDRFAGNVIKSICAGLSDDHLVQPNDAPVTHLRLFMYEQSAERDPNERLVPGFTLSADLPFLDEK